MSDWTYRGTCIRVIDGDTMEVELSRDHNVSLDVGFHVHASATVVLKTRQTLRLVGIDTPEVVGASREAGLAAKSEVMRLMLASPALRVVTYKNPEKYGRWLADVYLTMPEGEELHLNEHLVQHGFAVRYPR